MLLVVQMAYLHQHTQICPHLRNLHHIRIFCITGLPVLHTSMLLRQHSLQDSPSVILRFGESGPDSDRDGFGEVGRFADGADVAQCAECEARVKGIDGLVDEREVVGDDCVVVRQYG